MTDQAKTRGDALRAVLLLCGLVAGCNNRSEMLHERDVAPMGDLPSLQTVADPQLRDELARIVEDGGTPEQLAAEPIPDKDNVWHALDQVQRRSSRTKSSGQSIEIFIELYPRPEQPFPRESLREAAIFRSRFANRWDDVKEALRRPDCDFGLDPRKGQFVDLSFIDLLQTLSRVDAFIAARSISSGELYSAVEPIGSMLLMARHLGKQRHLGCRLAAAQMRSEALLVIEAACRHKMADRQLLQDIQELLLIELALWSPDADAWIGDRAQALHGYEVIRAGQINNLIDADFEEHLAYEGLLKEFLHTAQHAIDPDQLYYLKTMRSLIAAAQQAKRSRNAKSCKARRYAMQRIYDGMRNRDKDAETLIATRLFLAGLSDAIRHIDEDRAACEAWVLALAYALGHKRSKNISTINPVSGTPYQESVENGVAVVWHDGGGIGGVKRPVRVPVPAGTSNAAARTKSR
jgi:hypothetical protein